MKSNYMKFALIGALAMILLLSGCVFPSGGSEDTAGADSDIAKSPAVAAGGCAEIADSDLKDNCFREDAAANNNLAGCENISDLDVKNVCYWELGTQRGSTTVCAKITAQELREDCFYIAEHPESEEV